MKLIKEKSTLVAKEPDFTFCVEELPLNLKRMLCYVKKSGDAPKKCRRDGENFSVTLNINNLDDLIDNFTDIDNIYVDENGFLHVLYNTGETYESDVSLFASVESLSNLEIEAMLN